MQVALISTEMDVWDFGLRTISAVLKAAGHHTRLIMMTTGERQFAPQDLDQLVALTRDADVIGVGCLARGSAKAAQLIDRLHSEGATSTKAAPIIWGGVHASLNPAECADHADMVCVGEGEELMLELLERLAEGRDWHDLQNLAYKNAGGLRMNPLRPPIRDLDALPLPDFSFENEYRLTERGLIPVDTLAQVATSGQIMFNGSRGCAFRCTYCCNRKLKELYAGAGRGARGGYVRRMSVPRLIEHARALRQIFPEGKYFYFIDEDFGARPMEELREFAEAFPREVGVPFACLTHPAQVSPAKMDALVQAGLFRLYMGVESGSERTRREVYDRHVSNEVILRAAQTVARYPQVLPTYFFIIANPYEERADLLETVRLIAALPQGAYAIIYNLIFFPGSALYERAVADGLIRGEADCGYELNFLGGLNYTQHSWKKKNLYLNGLIFMLEGRAGRRRVGILPRGAIDALLSPRLMAYGEGHPWLIRSMISLTFVLKAARHRGARLLAKVLRNPTAVYNLRHYLRTEFLGRHKPAAPGAIGTHQSPASGG